MKVALIADARGWCWWHQAQGIARNAPAEYHIEVATGEEFDTKRAGEFDGVLHFSWPECPTHMAAETRLTSVLAHHGCQWMPDQFPGELRAVSATRLRNRREFDRVVDHLNGVICVNRQLLHHAAQRHMGAAWIPAGVDTNVYEPNGRKLADDRRLRVGWCGQAKFGEENTKGRKWVLDPLMAHAGLGYDWRIRDRGPWEPFSQEEMIDWYGDLDVLICTSISEGTPMPPLEAMSCGVPVISTRVGDLEEVIDSGTNGVLVGAYRNRQEAERTVAQFLAALRIVNGDRGLDRWMGENARRTILERRSWRELAGRWLNYIAGG